MTRYEAIGVVLAILSLVLIGIMSQTPGKDAPAVRPTTTGQQYCVITTPEEEGGSAVLCSIIDMKDV